MKVLRNYSSWEFEVSAQDIFVRYLSFLVILLLVLSEGVKFHRSIAAKLLEILKPHEISG